MDKNLSELIGKLNKRYEGRLEIVGLLKKLPVITHEKTFVVPDEMQPEYNKNKAYLENTQNFVDGMNHNEKHAVFWGNLDNNCLDQNTLDCWETDYAACKTYRLDYKKTFPLVTGNALVICPDTGTFILQKRADNVDWNPGAYSLFGGGYLPELPDGQPADQGDITNTIYREFKEESGGDVDLIHKHYKHVLLTKELKAGARTTGSIQFNVLGAEINEQALQQLNPGWEGQIVHFAMNNIKTQLENNTWTEFAEASVLIWLFLFYHQPSLLGKVKSAISLNDVHAILESTSK